MYGHSHDGEQRNHNKAAADPQNARKKTGGPTHEETFKHLYHHETCDLVQRVMYVLQTFERGYCTGQSLDLLIHGGSSAKMLQRHAQEVSDAFPWKAVDPCRLLVYLVTYGLRRVVS
jgi:hypothetical protein